MKLFHPEDFLILVIDDIPQNLSIVGNVLENAGYNTTFAINGKQGLERARVAQPDLILLDLMMPEIDGIQVCQSFKSDPNLVEIPVIFLTASNDKKHLLRAFNEGAVDYITKPCDKTELLARVNIHLKLKYTTEQLKQALEEVKKLADTDFLTGIYNRRYFYHVAGQEFNRSIRYKNSFSILIIDLDYFKSINDTYNHLIGDEVLKAVVKIIKSFIRTVDCFARFGGEEFILLLPETGLKNAIQAAQRICTTIANYPIKIQELVLSVTVSIGVATYGEDDPTIEAIIQRADQALYQAKKEGRNRVIFNL